MDMGLSAEPRRNAARSGPRDGRRLASLQIARTWPSLAACAFSALLLIKLAFASGGYYPTGFLPVGVLAFGGLAVLLFVHLPQWKFSVQALFALGALAVLAVWTGLSTTWSSNPAGALEDLQADIVYLGMFAVALVAAGSGRHARLIPWAGFGVILIVCGAGLISRLYPDVIHVTTPSELQAARLGYPLTYWNAYGAMAAMGIVLGMGLASDAGTAAYLRALAGALTVPLGVGLWFSLSRGSWLSLIVGLVVLLLVGHRRGSVLVTMAIVGGGTAIAILRLSSYKILTDGATAPGSAAAGHRYAGQLFLIAAACGAAMVFVGAARGSAALSQSSRRVLRPVALWAGALVVFCAVVFYAVDSNAVEGHAATRSHAVSNWVSRQWQDFLRPSTFGSSGTTRLLTSKGTRSDMYRVAIDSFENHPLRGAGSSSFINSWYKGRTLRGQDVTDVHSLELQTMAELGLVGTVILLTFLGSVILAATKARRKPGALVRAQSSAIIAALSVWLVHSAVDWDWQMPALTGTALLLAAAVFPAGHRRIRRKSGDPMAGLDASSWYFEDAVNRADPAGPGHS